MNHWPGPARCLLPLLVLILFSACTSTQAPSTRFYLLTTDAVNRPPSIIAPARVTVNQIQVASYLQQPGIVMELDDGSVRAASFHQWGEPLRDGLRRSLANEIAQAIEEPVRISESGALAAEAPADYVIDLFIPRLHVTRDGTVTLEALWSIRAQTDSGDVTEHELRLTSPLAADGYAAVVTAHEQVLAALAGSIAEALSTRLGTGL